MIQENEVEHLRRRLAECERKSTRTKWLLSQLGLKIRHFPRDFSRRLRRSLQKRTGKPAAPPSRSNVVAASMTGALNSFAAYPFNVGPERAQDLEKLRATDPTTAAALVEMMAFFASREMTGLVAEAARFDPEVSAVGGSEASYCPPWHDVAYSRYRVMAEKVPPGPYDAVVLMPAGRMGGADLVAALLATALAREG